MSEALETFADEAAWAQAAADALAGALRGALERNGRAGLAVAGGSTPAPILARLGEDELDWGRVTITLTDERWVPEDHADSNARMVRSTLLTGRATAAAFAPLRGAAESPEAAALAVSERLAAEGPPDAVLLGMGEDGHIASIFPGNARASALLNAGAAPACLDVPAGHGRPPAQERLSLNLPALTRGEVVLALRGEAKRRMFETAGAAPIAALRESGARLRVLWTEDR